MTAKTKVGLPENRKRLGGAGLEKAINSYFDDGYTAGWNAGKKYYRQILLRELEEYGFAYASKYMKDIYEREE